MKSERLNLHFATRKAECLSPLLLCSCLFLSLLKCFLMAVYISLVHLYDTFLPDSIPKYKWKEVFKWVIIIYHYVFTLDWASSPLESRGPITLYSTLVQSSEEYLYAYLEDTLTLNVYRPDGTFLHSYMMPNENCGTSSLHSYMGDVYISVYRNSGIHRYGPTGDYLGSFEDDILYTANGKYRGRFEIPPHYEVIGFTDEFLYLFVRETGAFYCTSKNG